MPHAKVKPTAEYRATCLLTAVLLVFSSPANPYSASWECETDQANHGAAAGAESCRDCGAVVQRPWSQQVSPLCSFATSPFSSVWSCLELFVYPVSISHYCFSLWSFLELSVHPNHIISLLFVLPVTVCPSISHYQSSLCSACNCLSIHIALSVFSLGLSGTVCPSISHYQSSLCSTCNSLSIHIALSVFSLFCL